MNYGDWHGGGTKKKNVREGTLGAAFLGSEPGRARSWECSKNERGAQSLADRWCGGIEKGIMALWGISRKVKLIEKINKKKQAVVNSV